jgi:hypothetical protein
MPTRELYRQRYDPTGSSRGAGAMLRRTRKPHVMGSRPPELSLTAPHRRQLGNAVLVLNQLTVLASEQPQISRTRNATQQIARRGAQRPTEGQQF